MRFLFLYDSSDFERIILIFINLLKSRIKNFMINEIMSINTTNYRQFQIINKFLA